MLQIVWNTVRSQGWRIANIDTIIFAEQPGEFSALPAKIEAMYAPELKGNSDENKIQIQDTK
jgi:uncharacterized protein YfaS (alpha-2-macroglobulin family)